jgi:nucleoside-diphosphate-sugar epimerase
MTNLVTGATGFIGSHVIDAHISDMVQAKLLAGATPMAAGRVYHIADGTRTSIGDFIRFLALQVGADPPRRTLPLLLHMLACLTFDLWNRLSPWPLHGPISRGALHFLGTSRFVDICRARVELGFFPRVSYRDGLANTLAWIHEERNGRPQPALSSS